MVSGVAITAQNLMKQLRLMFPEIEEISLSCHTET
jgi:hypothetical protein